jgi:Mrp family chromosome partitioning ATPase/capsular polysaccharide biosynthesis protein
MNDTPDASSIFAPLWRRKWLILTVGIVVGVGSYFYYRHQRPTYGAGTQLYLGAGSEEQAPGEKATTKVQQLSTANQAAVITSIIVPTVRTRLIAEHGAAFVRGSKVRAKAPEKSQFITISTEAHSAQAAAQLANLTAVKYIARARLGQRRTIERAIALTRRQLRRVELSSAPTPSSSRTGKKPGSSGPTTASILQATALSAKINQLEGDLAVGGVQQVKPARPDTAKLESPHPRHDAIFGFVLGIVLASILAYALSRFDRRLRSLAGIEAAFHAPILAALPKVARPIVHREAHPQPSKVLLEPLRRLSVGLQLGDGLNHEGATGRIILLVSPDAGDGKSTVVADLALVQRDSGRRVAIVEANVRRPVQARLLGLDCAHGLAEVLAGVIPVEHAMQRVTPVESLALDDADERTAVATAVESRAGSLFLLAGGYAPNPPALLAHAALPGLLCSLASEFDYVLIDAPSPLEFSDAIPLLRLADGILILARVGHTREVAAGRLVDMLPRAGAAPTLGVVANCVARKDSEGYGFSMPNGRVWTRKRPIGR